MFAYALYAYRLPLFYFILTVKVQVTFPDSSEKSDVVKIRGPKQDVDAAYKHLQKLYKELLESSYSVKVRFLLC